MVNAYAQNNQQTGENNSVSENIEDGEYVVSDTTEEDAGSDRGKETGGDDFDNDFDDTSPDFRE